jgi:hypothetical protein
MADDTGSKQLAAVGRLLSVLGFVMVGLAWFGDDLLARLGLNLGNLSGPLVIFGFVAITAGRAIKRRATPKTDEPESPRPVVLRPGQEVAAQPKPHVAAQPKPDVAVAPTKPKPKPAPEPLKQTRTEVAKSLEQVVADMEGEAVDTVESGAGTGASLEELKALDAAPKTSAEMLEEAKHQFDVEADES